jgi:hypothetical protein
MRYAKVIAGLAIVGVAAGATGAARAAGGAPSRSTIKAITTAPKVKINRYIQDGLRWDKDVYQVKSGGTLHIVNDAADEGPHTFTVVRKGDEPKNGRQMVNCAICMKLGQAHGADPNSDAPPKFQYLENGVGQSTPPNVDRPGDSGVTGPGQKGETIDLKVTAKRGTVLQFMCLIHPWMQAKVEVK